MRSKKIIVRSGVIISSRPCMFDFIGFGKPKIENFVVETNNGKITHDDGDNELTIS